MVAVAAGGERGVVLAEVLEQVGPAAGPELGVVDHLLELELGGVIALAGGPGDPLEIVGREVGLVKVEAVVIRERSLFCMSLPIHHRIADAHDRKIEQEAD